MRGVWMYSTSLEVLYLCNFTQSSVTPWFYYSQSLVITTTATTLQKCPPKCMAKHVSFTQKYYILIFHNL